MKKYFTLIIMMLLFIPKVYAFTYDMNVKADKLNVLVNDKTEIKVSLTNVQGTSDGIASCSLNIKFDETIKLSSNIRTLGGWTMTTGNFYLFDTGMPVTSASDLFVIPISVTGNGNVKITDIVCSDGNTNETIEDKIISLTVVIDTDNNDNNNNNNGHDNEDNDDDTDDKSKSDCDLVNIILSEGEIDFDSSVTEYSVKISNFESFVVNPKLSNPLSEVLIDKIDEDDNKRVVITVTAPDGSSKIYTIYVDEINNDTDSNNKKDKVNYTPIFISIIGILVLINIIRIIKNIISKKKS